MIDEPGCSTQDDAGRGKTAVMATELGVRDKKEPLLGDAFQPEKRLDRKAEKDVSDEILVARNCFCWRQWIPEKQQHVSSLRSLLMVRSS